MNRARKFYEAVMDTRLGKLDAPDTGAAELDIWMFPHKENALGCTGALVKTEGVSPGPGGTMVHFSCEDCAIEEARIAPNGGEVVRSKFSIAPYGFVAIAKDAEGNTIGFYSMK